MQARNRPDNPGTNAKVGYLLLFAYVIDQYMSALAKRSNLHWRRSLGVNEVRGANIKKIGAKFQRTSNNFATTWRKRFFSGESPFSPMPVQGGWGVASYTQTWAQGDGGIYSYPHSSSIRVWY
jgi:hypothetical protein